MKGYFFLLLLFLVGCAVNRFPLKEVCLNDKVFFDKVRVNYSDKVSSVSLKGKIAVYKDSLVLFKFYGPLGLEVFSGQFDSVLNIKSKYSDYLPPIDLNQFYLSKGIHITRRAIEYLLLYRSDELFKELKGNSDSKFEISKSVVKSTKNVILLRDRQTNSDFRIILESGKRIPMTIVIDCKDTISFFRVSIDLLSVHN